MAQPKSLSLDNKTLLKKGTAFLKKAWLVAVVVLASKYLVANLGAIKGALLTLSMSKLFAALCLSLLGKSVVIKVAHFALQSTKTDYSYREIFRLYNRTQLAKYLPGGVWHIVGRAGIYTQKGLSAKEAGLVLFRENGWLILSSISFGLLLGAPALSERLHLPLMFTLAVPLIMYSTGAKLSDRLFGGHTYNSLPWQFLTWTIYGLSFAMLLPKALSLSLVTQSVAAFSLAFGLGLAFPIAPSGIGIREAVLCWFFIGTLTTQEAFAMAAIARLVWTAGELLMAILAEHSVCD